MNRPLLKRAYQLIHFCVVGLFLQGCGGPAPLIRFIPGEGCWSREVPMQYEVEEAPVSLSVLFEDDYDFSNLYLRVQVKENEEVIADTVFSQVVVDPYGEWVCESNGGIHTCSFPLNIGSPAAGSQLVVHQYMRPDKLCGIKEVQVQGASGNE
ncbi:MAG: hypothetical protein AAGI38_04785 [Bacteroidota bacterium]